MVQKNDKIELTIDSLTSEGSGVGKYNGFAVFVRGTVPGDRIFARIIKTSKNYGIGIIDEVLEPSDARIQSDCTVSDRCGGCSFRNVQYDEELKYKKERVNDALKRIGHLDIKVNDIIGADVQNGYRNKAQYPVKIENGELIAGFYAYKSHRIIPCMDCKLQPKEFTDGLRAVALWAKESGVTSYDEKSEKGLLRHIYFRKGFGSGEVMACVVINGDSIPKQDRLIELLCHHVDGLKSIVLNINKENTNVILGRKTKTIWGNDTICDILLDKHFILSPDSFYQVNHDQCEKLYSLVREYAALNKDETLLDLYCGTGTIGLTMAQDCKNLIGVEIVENAIKNARKNAQINNVKNARFICSDAKAAVRRLLSEGVFVDTVIVDPPRKGCDKGVFDAIESLKAKRIVYVSCDPSTLARDIAILKEKNYLVQCITAIDLFPRTPHTECVALLSQIKPR